MPRNKKKTNGIGNGSVASRIKADARPHPLPRQYPIVSAVKIRRMTQEEERQLEAAIDLFLMTTVHEHFER